MSSDYVPHSDEILYEWGENLLAKLRGKLNTYGIPEDAFEVVDKAFAVFETYYHKAHEPNRGKVDVFNKNEARDAFTKEVRLFIQAYVVNNPRIPDADKTGMGVPVHGKKHSPSPDPNTIPELVMDTSVLREVIVRFRDAGKKRYGKPPRVRSMELRWAILDSPPASETALVNSEFVTASPFTFKFGETERGKRLYICARWESPTTAKGPWSHIYIVVIP